MHTVYVDYFEKGRKFVISSNGSNQRAVSAVGFGDFKKQFLKAYQGIQVEDLVFRLYTTNSKEIDRLKTELHKEKLDLVTRTQRGCSNFNADNCSDSISCPAYCEW